MNATILKAYDELGECLMVVYGANRPGVDKQGDVVDAHDLWMASATWAAGGRKVRLQHNGKDVPPDVAYAMSSYMTGSKPYKGDGYTVPALSWALWIKVNLEGERGRKVWRDIKDEKLSGLSMGGKSLVTEFAEGD